MDSSKALAWFIAIAGRIAFLALWLASPIVNSLFSNALVPVLGKRGSFPGLDQERDPRAHP